MSALHRSRPAVAALAISATPLPLHALVPQRHQHVSGRHPTIAAAQNAAPEVAWARPSAPPRHRNERPRAERRASRTWRLVMPAGTPARVAHADGDPTDTISDFKFSPASLTIHVGDTVTWSNAGPSPHSATANDGSFDTGLLQKGASGSHTFSQPGTFTYFCTIHPFMHGTIVVVASTSSSSSNAGGGATGSSSSTPTATTGSAASPATTTGSSSGQGLPVTGLDAWLAVAVGAALVGAGIVIRSCSGAG